MKKILTNSLIALGVGVTTFSITFLLTTAFLDYVCQHNGYYQEAASEAVVMND